MRTSLSGRAASFFPQLVQAILPFAVLLLFLALGDVVQSSLGTWIPGSVIGMLLLLAVLSTNVVPATWLDRTADWLLDRLGLFFVCPGVEVIKYLHLVESHWLSLALAIAGSSFVTIVATGWIGEMALSREKDGEAR